MRVRAGAILAGLSLALLLLAATLLVAFLLRPPLLGWIGFALACAVVLGLAAVATIASSRLRMNPARPAAARDAFARLLVVADEHCGSPGLWQAIDSRLDGAVAVHLVVPLRVSHLHYLTNDEAGELRAADERAQLAISLLRERGVEVTGGAGSDDPLESMTDALGFFPATRVLFATSSRQDSYWLEQDLVAKARALTALQLDHVVVPDTAPTQLEEVVFDGVPILTAPGAVMRPQTATEALVEVAVELIGSGPARVAEVGTGTGAVGVAIALRAPNARVLATDDSEAAIALARRNVARHGLQGRIEVLHGNLLEPVPGRLDLVVANLPYHAEARSRSHGQHTAGEQPEHALYAPGDGLRLYRELIEACRTSLDERGVLVLQLYGSVLSAGRGELGRLLEEIEARAAEGWEARAAAAAAGTSRSWKPWHASPPGAAAETSREPVNRT